MFSSETVLGFYHTILMNTVYRFRNDPTAASVVTSILPNGNFYLSIIRYTRPFAQGKEVIFTYQADSFDRLIVESISRITVRFDGEFYSLEELNKLYTESKMKVPQFFSSEINPEKSTHRIGFNDCKDGRADYRFEPLDVVKSLETP